MDEKNQSMQMIEDKLNDLGNEVRQLNSTVEILKSLYIEIKDLEEFTSNEKEMLLSRVKQYDNEREKKAVVFKAKFDMFENKVKKTKGELILRRKIIDKISESDLTDKEEIFSIFTSKQRSLADDLEKSIQTINIQ